MKRKFIRRYGGVENVPVWALLASGSCGGVSPLLNLLHPSFNMWFIPIATQIAYWLSCYPLDVIKSRVQLADKPPSSGGTFYIRREFGAVIRESGW